MSPVCPTTVKAACCWSSAASASRNSVCLWATINRNGAKASTPSEKGSAADVQSSYRPLVTTTWHTSSQHLREIAATGVTGGNDRHGQPPVGSRAAGGGMG